MHTTQASLLETPLSASSPFPPQTITTTTRLLIRLMHPADAPAMYKHASPPIIGKHMSLAFPSPYTLQSAETWISQNLTPPFNHFAVCLISSPSALIGGIGIKPGSDVHTHTAEIGYWLGQEYWGKGIVAEALQALTDWVFEVRGYQYRRLQACVYDQNTASIRCLEKCGYQFEGRLRGHVEKDGQVMDLMIYGMTKGDWEDLRREKENKAGGGRE
ncbi:acyl-CoA N-acyltransferase [Clohesyomyces aquaticus]|uniref:Acyl-CoA N-acyltransferase n=1 Tax=Clohesyomyces aquaticus TaxID=1231657 RepID=A0A1Y2A049_9PLEO|nr:acyl-CoA N-acyltransferase [Clohesyomyces aquaticus]